MISRRSQPGLIGWHPTANVARPSVAAWNGRGMARVALCLATALATKDKEAHRLKKS